MPGPASEALGPVSSLCNSEINTIGSAISHEPSVIIRMALSEVGSVDHSTFRIAPFESSNDMQCTFAVVHEQGMNASIFRHVRHVLCFCSGQAVHNLGLSSVDQAVANSW